MSLMKDFIENFGKNYGFDTAASTELFRHADKVGFRKNDLIVECGGYDDTLYILQTGICRAFRSQVDRNLTLWFAFGGDAVFDIFCYHGKSASKIGIEAETDCTAFAIRKECLEDLCASSATMANAVRRIFERHAFVFENNVFSLFDCEDGSERYLSLLNRHPELLKHIPLKKLASYLLVTPQSLSRIRANLK